MIEAEFACKCPGCGEWIAEGDRIGVVDGDWVCATCVDEADGEDDRDHGD
jgi:formylmethanofuran dehydrogenase subunit E